MLTKITVSAIIASILLIIVYGSQIYTDWNGLLVLVAVLLPYLCSHSLSLVVLSYQVLLKYYEECCATVCVLHGWL